MTEANYTRIEKLAEWAGERGRTLGELAHAWLLAQPQVCSVISGLTRLDHLLQNLKGADWDLTSEDLTQIGEVLDDKS